MLNAYDDDRRRIMTLPLLWIWCHFSHLLLFIMDIRTTSAWTARTRIASKSISGMGVVSQQIPFFPSDE